MDAFQSAMGKKVETAWLLAFYGALLTDNQQEILRLYYEEDLTLTEIAEQFGVSRQSVHDTVQRAGQQLSQFEEKLGLCARFQRTEEQLDHCMEALKKVRATEETAPYLSSALQALNALKGEEEK